MTNRTATAYRVIVPNEHGGGGIYRDHYPFGTTRDDAYAVAARIPGAYVEVSANGVTGWTDDAPRDDAAAAEARAVRDARVAERAARAAEAEARVSAATRVAEAEARVSAARRAVADAEDEARGAHFGSPVWYAVGAADDELRDAEHALSTARLARDRAERAAGERAAAARYAAEAEAERRAYAYRTPIYGRGA